MRADDIQIVTDPTKISSLINAKPQMSNDPETASSGASVDEILAKIEQDKMSKADQAKALAQLQDLSKPKPQPLKLEYKFTGNDSEGHPVTTLEVDVDNKHFVMAYCLTESKTIITHELISLNQFNSKSDIIPKKEKERG